MKLNQLKDNPGAKFSRKRRGRGIGSGLGKTGGRGVKGQKSRTGVAIKGFEGGQMPLHRRLPKRGFTPWTTTTYRLVNLGDLQKAVDEKRIKSGAKLDTKALEAAGLIRRGKNQPVKLLGKGELKTALELTVNKASESAVKALEKAGGKLEVVTFVKPEPKAKKEAPKKEEAKKAAAPKKAAAKKAAPKKDSKTTKTKK